MSEIAVRVQKALREAAAGKPMEARAALQQLAARYPCEPRVHAGLSDLMLGLGDLNAALNHAAAWAQIAENDSAPHRQIGRIMTLSQRPDIAVKAFTKALELDPKDIDARGALAGVHLMLGHAADAMETANVGLAQRPADPRLAMLLARSQMNLTRIEDAVATLEKAVAAHPRDIDLAETLAVAMNYLPGASPAQTLALHKRHAELTTAKHRLPVQRHTTRVTGKRPLTIGLLSADLRGHSVGFFIEPLLKHLDAERFTVHCYFTGRKEDETSQRLRALSSVWRNLGNLDPGPLAKTIAADKIDIVIDLAGLSMGHRLAALAAKPAPIIVNYLGYPNTTGLAGVDFRIVDAHTDPSPAADAHSVERLLRLDPCFLCYQPPADAPTPARTDADPGITFACFNALPKLNDQLFALWARVLDRVPGSQLLIKNAGLIDERSRAFVAERLAAAGIPSDRFELAAWTAARGDHLSSYNRVDVALDTFPYHGTTTTCESLLMGVPVVTLAGQVHASRVGISLLNAVGHPEWIAQTADQYADITAQLADDASVRAALRSSLRAEMLASPLCDAPAFARRFGEALVALWHQHAGGTPA